jgi:hypothetical protein
MEFSNIMVSSYAACGQFGAEGAFSRKSGRNP